MKQSKQWDIKSAMVLAGAFHFLYSCGRACLMPFLTLYLRHLGLSAYMVGIVMGTRHLICLIWHPLSSLLARHHDKRRVVIIGSLVGSAGLGLAFLLLPSTGVATGASICNTTTSPIGLRPTTEPANSHLESHITGPKHISPPPSNIKLTVPAPHLTGTESVPVGNATTITQSNSLRGKIHEGVSVSKERGDTYSQGAMDMSPHTKGKAAPHRRADMSQKEEEVVTKEDESRFEFLGSLNGMDAHHQLFFLVLIVMGVWELVAAPLEWTADDGIYEYLDFVDATDRQGQVWVWRLLGGACGVFGAGLLVSNLDCFLFGGSSVPRGAVHFFAYALFMLVTVPEATFLPLYLNHKQGLQRGGRANNGVKALRLIREDPRALLCTVTACLVGASGAVIEDFLPWQIQDHGGGELQVGVALGLAFLFQVAFLPLLRSGCLSRFLGPHSRFLLLATAGRVLQCLYYSFLWAPWSVLPVQALDCLSVSGFWWALQAQGEDVATPGTERAVQKVYQALALDLGGGLGSFAGGLVVHKFGVAVLFQGLAAGLCAWCLVLCLLHWKIPRQRRINYSRLLAADVSEASETESDQERDWLDKAIKEENCKNNNKKYSNN